MNQHKKNPFVLAILDGWGIGPKDKKINAIYAAKTPFIDYLEKKYPKAQLNATGSAVGLEENQMSGSEAGHLNIGAGRVVKQDVRVILEEISNGSFFHHPTLLNLVEKTKKTGGKIHLMGLLGNTDSPHSHPDIFMALLNFLKFTTLKDRVFIHLFTDGRDSFPRSALEHWKKWEAIIKELGVGRLASVCGRFFSMDRVKNWDRSKKAYNLLVSAKGRRARSFEEAIDIAYSRGETDEYVEPTVILNEDNLPVALIADGDGIIFFNLRSDRARQFSKLFVGKKEDDEEKLRVRRLKNINFLAMTNFGPDLNLSTLYSAPPISFTLPAAMGDFYQLYISETEKYAHVTYFINGGYASPVAGEERILIDSPNVKSYADKPEMAGEEIASIICDNLEHNIYDFVVVNFPNADMVGHTGNFEATVKGVEFVDAKLAQIYKKLKEKGGTLMVTADHGNADVMVEKETGRLFTFHTKNPVPLFLAGEQVRKNKLTLEPEGKLADIAPTILDFCSKIKAEEMTGRSLLKRNF